MEQMGLGEQAWKAAALVGVRNYRRGNPQGWERYVADAEDLSAADAPVED
jgi:hypothetical protein